MDIKPISDKIYSNTNDRSRMERMNELYYSMVNLIKEEMPSAYKEYTEKAAKILYELTSDEAREIVRNMRPSGEKWSENEVYSYMESIGENPHLDYYLAMNMAYNDYRNTATKFDVDINDFYFSIAKDFVEDEDGKPYKVARYFSED